MGRTLDEILASLPKERRERIEANAAEMIREVEGLKALRKLAARSQDQLAQSLGVKEWRA